MDTDLDLVNLALEQEVLTREAQISNHKAEEKWTRVKGYLNMLVILLDGNYLWYEPDQLNQDTLS